MWIPPEDFDPIVLQEPTREGISVFGSLDAGSGSLITKITESYNALTFMEFLTSIPTGGKETTSSLTTRSITTPL